ncbi:FG-GAP-like repeat-containing protein [Streptomyces sp. NPDC012888]|uniref:FG-GAP-like repeat-containing protein n=1 Tax=Streptomyces sp. NPDC012888 TaxID=3364855 RepID=UPI0036B07317
MFHRRTSAAIAVAAALTTLAVPLTAAPAFAADAPEPGAELVLPAPKHMEIGGTTLHAATSQGVIRGHGIPSRFTPFGQDTSVEFDAKGTDRVYGTGTDTIALHQQATRTVILRDGHAGAEESFVLPANLTLYAVTGRKAVAVDWTVSGRGSVHLLWLQDGQLRDRELAVVSGVQSHHSNSRGVLFVHDSQSPKELWIDTTGEGRAVPLGSKLPPPLVVGDYLIRTNPLDFEVYDTRKDFTTPIHRFPRSYNGFHAVGLVGSELLITDYTREIKALAGDGSRRVLGKFEVDIYRPRLTPAPGNRLLGLAVREDRNWFDIHEFKADAEGRAQAVRVSAVAPQPVEIADLAVENGRLHTVEKVPSAWGVDMPHSSDLFRTRTLDHADPAKEARPAAVRTTTLREIDELVSNGADRLLYMHPDSKKLAEKRLDTSSSYKPITSDTVMLPNSLQATGRYAAFRTAAPGNPVEVHDLLTNTKGRGFPAPGGAFALSGSALWRNTATAGTVEALDVRTGAVLRTDKPAGCAIKEMQAFAASLYWKCDTESGVYDTGTKTSVRLPAYDGTARLGQGFVAFTDGPALKVADVKGGTGVREIARPLTTRPGKGWAVDRFTGRIAHVDEAHAVHVRSAGVAAPLGVYDQAAPTTAELGAGRTWTPSWWLTKPAASWTLTLTSKATGASVLVRTGYETRGAITTSWDGRDASGRNVPNGAHTWTLTVKPADGQGPELKRAGSVTLTGRAAHRDYTGDTRGDMFTRDSKGGLQLHTSSGPQNATGWPATSTAVPFGDMNDDRANDVLVRDASGLLRVYLAAPGKPVSPRTPSKYIGSGWGQYDVLTLPGDMTGDGRGDLIARQATTGDIYFYAQDGAGGFKPRVRIMLNWKLYKHVLGAGDLNGDGVGDLLAVDGNGTMWRYDGVKGGTVKPRVQVGPAGWLSKRFQFAGTGDVTADGKPDLVSRDVYGNLLRNAGTGTGGFGPTFGMRTPMGGYVSIH